MRPGRNSPRIGLKLIRTGELLVLVVLSLWPSVVLCQQSAAPKRIFVLYWYDKDYPGHIRFGQSFQAALKSAPWGEVEYYPEYLESNRFPGEDQSLLLRDYLRKKYADRTIDVVVAATDASLDFLLKYRKGLFPHAPIVFEAAEGPTAEELAAEPGLTGIIHVNTHRATLDLALRLHPATRQVLVISGTLSRDKKFERLAREELQGYESRVLITYLTDLPPDELIEKMKTLPERSIVLYVWQQAQNQQGKILESQDVLAIVARSATVPIYGMSSNHVGSGIIGGYVSTTEGRAIRTAEIALQVANGARAQDIPVESAPTVPMFDWRELRRLGINEDMLPAGSIFQFKEQGFWDLYRWHVIGVVSVCMVEAFLIFALLAQRARRRLAEEGLRLSEEKFSKAFLASPDALAIIRRSDGIILEVNDHWEMLLGYSRDEASGRTTLDLGLYVNPEDRGEFFRIVEERSFVHDFETDLRSNTGDLLRVILSAEPISINTVPCLLTIIHDITERKRAQDALVRSEARYRAIVEDQTELICRLLPDGTLTFVNESYARYFDRTPAELVGRSFRPFIPAEEEELITQFMTLFNPSNPVATVEHRVVPPSGELRWQQWTDRAIYDEQGRLVEFQCVGRDITERKRADEALRKSEEALRESYNRLEDLAGRLIVAQEEERKHIARELHDDLNQQVAALAIGLGKLERQLPESNGPVRNQLMKLEDRTTELSERIRRLSRELHSSTLEHVGLAEALKLHCSEFIEQHGIAVSLNLYGGTEPLPSDVALCLYRVAQESLRNIAKHSRAKSAELTLVMNEESIELRIADKGMGFDLKDPSRGEGLGLVSMEERVRLLGGTLEVKSQPGAGTELKVYVRMGASNE